MSGKRLVILPDSPYTDIIIEKCLSTGFDCIFVTLTTGKKPVYIKHTLCRIIKYRPFIGYRCELSDLASITAVYVNLNGVLTAHFIDTIVRRQNSECTLICMFWSAELYNHPSFRQPLYDTYSNRFKNSKRILLQNNLFAKILEIFNMPRLTQLTAVNSSFKYFCALFEEEFRLFAEVFPSNVRFQRFTLLDTSNFLIPEGKNIKKNNILLGNSAAIENNHHDALDILASSQFTASIICPLSYGNVKYRESVIERGCRYFGSRFQPLTDFLPMNDYNRIMSSIRVAIFNHYIQQAFGNIIALLFFGARVYLSKRNPLYRGLRHLGFEIFCLEEFSAYLDTELDGASQALNRELVDKYLSLDVSRAYYYQLMKLGDVK